MDHLWLDKDAQRAPDRVPVLGLAEYDGHGFHKYLARLGIEESDLRDGIFAPLSAPVDNGDATSESVSGRAASSADIAMSIGEVDSRH